MTLEEWLRDKVILEGLPLRTVVEEEIEDMWSCKYGFWLIDVLSDGTAITYSDQ